MVLWGLFLGRGDFGFPAGVIFLVLASLLK